jgi:hypothetical protein
MKHLAQLSAVALVATIASSGAYAQATRTFVSGHGSDGDPCSLAAPCRSFQVAHNATNPKGEIVVLDSAGYGPLTISKSISIVNPGGVEAGATPQSGGEAITIAAGPNDTVSLRGLTIEGAGTGNNGITFNSGLRLEIIDCVIRDFTFADTSTGININPNAFSSVYVSNTITSDNSVGVNVLAPGLVAVLDRYTSINNQVGVNISGLFGTVTEVLLSNSQISNNILSGIDVFNANAVLRNTNLNQNPHAIFLEGNANVWLSQVTEVSVPGLPNNGGVIFQGGGNHVYSDGTNRLAGFSGGSPEVWFVQ